MRRALGTFWRRFKVVSQAVGNGVARVILTVFYFVLMAPFALVTRWRLDPLKTTNTSASGWVARPSVADDPARARRQF